MSEQLYENSVIISILILVMFIISGINKIFMFNGVLDNVTQKLSMISLPVDLYRLIVLAVILLEICAPIIIINYFINGSNKNESYYSIIALIIFTILATLIYHFPDFSNYKKSIPFWANISLLGGLMLLAKKIRS